MKKVMYTAVCLIFTGILFAGHGTCDEKNRKGNHKSRKQFNPAKMSESMTKNLDLTSKQKIQTQKFSKKFHEKAKEIRNSNLEGSKKCEAIMELRKKLKSNIDSVLTPEQKEKAKQNRQKRKRERKQKKECAEKQNKGCGICPNQ